MACYQLDNKKDVLKLVALLIEIEGNNFQILNVISDLFFHVFVDLQDAATASRRCLVSSKPGGCFI